jgi:hypothetical protein
MPNWFESLFGFTESPTAVKANLVSVPGNATKFKSLANGRVFDVGTFTTPTLAQLRTKTAALGPLSERTGSIRHLTVDDVFELHAKNPGALFQAASQFNCLEFVSPDVIPEEGVTGYQNDATQGPACALACAAGTIYRNWMVPVPLPNGNAQIGQLKEAQLNGLDLLEALAGNDDRKFWKIKNGYTSSTEKGMKDFAAFLKDADRDELLGSIKIGLQIDVPVNFESRRPWKETRGDVRVHQAYCSAVSCGYDSRVSADLYAPFAKLVLDAAYEATLRGAVVAGAKTVYLTKLGGGVFGNQAEWIAKAIGRAIAVVPGLEVIVCHYRTVDQSFAQLVQKVFEKHSRP